MNMSPLAVQTISKLQPVTGTTSKSADPKDSNNDALKLGSSALLPQQTLQLKSVESVSGESAKEKKSAEEDSAAVSKKSAVSGTGMVVDTARGSDEKTLPRKVVSDPSAGGIKTVTPTLNLSSVQTMSHIPQPAMPLASKDNSNTPADSAPAGKLALSSNTATTLANLQARGSAANPAPAEAGVTGQAATDEPAKRAGDDLTTKIRQSLVASQKSVLSTKANSGMLDGAPGGKVKDDTASSSAGLKLGGRPATLAGANPLSPQGGGTKSPTQVATDDGAIANRLVNPATGTGSLAVPIDRLASLAPLVGAGAAIGNVSGLNRLDGPEALVAHMVEEDFRILVHTVIPSRVQGPVSASGIASGSCVQTTCRLTARVRPLPAEEVRLCQALAQQVGRVRAFQWFNGDGTALLSTFRPDEIAACNGTSILASGFHPSMVEERRLGFMVNVVDSPSQSSYDTPPYRWECSGPHCRTTTEPMSASEMERALAICIEFGRVSGTTVVDFMIYELNTVVSRLYPNEVDQCNRQNIDFVGASRRNVETVAALLDSAGTLSRPFIGDPASAYEFQRNQSIAHGKEVFRERCERCHNVSTGPNLRPYRVLGIEWASVDSCYDYSDSLREAAYAEWHRWLEEQDGPAGPTTIFPETWDPTDIVRMIANPRLIANGTNMPQVRGVDLDPLLDYIATFPDPDYIRERRRCRSDESAGGTTLPNWRIAAELYDQTCAGCHDGSGGPNLRANGAYGLRSGHVDCSRPGFGPLLAAGITWNHESLWRFLTAPGRLVPMMAQDAILDLKDDERWSIIQYIMELRVRDGGPECINRAPTMDSDESLQAAGSITRPAVTAAMLARLVEGDSGPVDMSVGVSRAASTMTALGYTATVETPADPATIERGRMAFHRSCTGGCHSDDGRNNPYPNITGCGIANVRAGHVGGHSWTPSENLLRLNIRWGPAVLRERYVADTDQQGVGVLRIGAMRSWNLEATELEPLIQYLMSIPVINAGDPDSDPACQRYDLVSARRN